MFKYKKEKIKNPNGQLFFVLWNLYISLIYDIHNLNFDLQTSYKQHDCENLNYLD